MRHIQLGTNTAVFMLFFLLSLLEAMSSRNYVLAALFMVLGIVSLRADTLRR